MKVIGICSSPNKKNSTTMLALEKCLDMIEAEGVETQLLALSQYKFGGCIDCATCRTKLACSQKDDFTNKILPLLNDPEIKGFVFASPVYFGGMTAQMKAFFDRAVSFRRNGFKWEQLVAGCISVGRSRHGGQELAIMDMARAAMIHGMVVVPDASPTSHFGGNLWSGAEGGIEHDAYGLSTAVNLGKSVASVVKKMYG